MSFSKLSVLIVTCLLLVDLPASWYWPFGDDEEAPPRLSELIEPASLLIDEASDLASEGKISDAVEKYREALVELDKIEAADPERAQTPEFATLRTKRAYVSAAIDSLLLAQARGNARPVAVSDTTELERRLAEEKGEVVTAAPKQAATEQTKEAPAPAAKVDEKAGSSVAKVEKQVARPAVKKRRAPAKARPDVDLTPKERAMKAIGEGKYDEAGRIIAAMLSESPSDTAALNLRAVKETAEGRYRDAERTLDRAIQSNPRSHYAYYNMAVLMLQSEPPNVDGARRYYETGRAMGGPVDPGLEEAFAK